MSEVIRAPWKSILMAWFRPDHLFLAFTNIEHL